MAMGAPSSFKNPEKPTEALRGDAADESVEPTVAQEQQKRQVLWEDAF